MRAPNGIRYVVQRTFRLGVVCLFTSFHFIFFFCLFCFWLNTKKNERNESRIKNETKKEKDYSTNTGTRLWRENANVEEPSFVYRFVKCLHTATCCFSSLSSFFLSFSLLRSRSIVFRAKQSSIKRSPSELKDNDSAPVEKARVAFKQASGSFACQQSKDKRNFHQTTRKTVLHDPRRNVGSFEVRLKNSLSHSLCLSHGLLFSSFLSTTSRTHHRVLVLIYKCTTLINVIQILCYACHACKLCVRLCVCSYVCVCM